MQPRVYRAAIIGLGFVGGGDQVSGDRIGQQVKHLDGHHRAAMSKNARVRLVAGCDLDAGRRERFAAATGAETFDDWRSMLERHQPEIVSIAVYTPAHAELAIACAAAGVRVVYCEKPIASSMAEAEQMIDACRRAGTLLLINHNRRFHPVFQKARAAIMKGDIGELTSIYLRWPTGRLGCVGTHFFDAATMLSGRSIRAVSATLDTSDKPDCRGAEFHDPGGWGTLRFDGGLMGVVNASNHNAGAMEMSIEGRQGRVVTCGGDLALQRLDGSQQLFDNPDLARSSMDRAVERIVAWLDNGSPVGVTAEESANSLAAIIGFHVSHARQSAWVELPLSGADREFRLLCG